VGLLTQRVREILSMSERPKFDYGEIVRIMGREHRGRLGVVAAINGSESSRTYTIEFGDGSDSEIAEEFLLIDSAD
jgi:ribosomal protein S4E